MEFTIGICDDLEEERLALANMISVPMPKNGASRFAFAYFPAEWSSWTPLLSRGGFRFFFWIFLCPINQGLR